MKKLKRFFLITGVILLIIAAACSIYVGDYYRADQTALNALNSDSVVTVQQNPNHTVFIPQEVSETGFIFYPGGKVEYTAYAPLLRMLAENDVLCVAVEMPFNLAVLDIYAADGIAEQYPQITRWYIGGHSLGGSMAASYALENHAELEGLVLLAAYSTVDLSKTSLDVISVYGSEDLILNIEKYEEYSDNLPSNFDETIISGGCHAYFGSYGTQKGDGIPGISVQEQHQITGKLLTEFFFQ